MRRTSFARNLTAITLMGAALVGCATDKRDSGTFVRLEEDKGKVVIGAKAFAQPAQLRVGFADILEREEYALFRGNGGQAETLFVEARNDMHTQTVLTFEYTVARSVQMWRFNQGQPITWGDSHFVPTTYGGGWVRTYHLTKSGHNCVGFATGWDKRPDDPNRRPTKGLFGYACKPAGAPMGESEADEIVKSIDLRGITMPLNIKTAYELTKGDPPALDKSKQVELLVAAQDGAPGGVSGIPEFPLLAALGFTMLDNGIDIAK